MCNCKDIEIGSYDRQTSMKHPFETKRGNNGWVCVDTCLVQEVAELWHLGIKTLESCCGHNKVDGYIAVENDDVEKMIELGYKPTDRKQIFLPKSV